MASSKSEGVGQLLRRHTDPEASVEQTGSDTEAQSFATIPGSAPSKFSIGFDLTEEHKSVLPGHYLGRTCADCLGGSSAYRSLLPESDHHTQRKCRARCTRPITQTASNSQVDQSLDALSEKVALTEVAMTRAAPNSQDSDPLESVLKAVPPNGASIVGSSRKSTLRLEIEPPSHHPKAVDLQPPQPPSEIASGEQPLIRASVARPTGHLNDNAPVARPFLIVKSEDSAEALVNPKSLSININRRVNGDAPSLQSTPRSGLRERLCSRVRSLCFICCCCGTRYKEEPDMEMGGGPHEDDQSNPPKWRSAPQNSSGMSKRLGKYRSDLFLHTIRANVYNHMKNCQTLHVQSPIPDDGTGPKEIAYCLPTSQPPLISFPEQSSSTILTGSTRLEDDDDVNKEMEVREAREYFKFLSRMNSGCSASSESCSSIEDAKSTPPTSESCPSDRSAPSQLPAWFLNSPRLGDDRRTSLSQKSQLAPPILDLKQSFAQVIGREMELQVYIGGTLDSLSLRKDSQGRMMSWPISNLEDVEETLETEETGHQNTSTARSRGRLVADINLPILSTTADCRNPLSHLPIPRHPDPKPPSGRRSNQTLSENAIECAENAPVTGVVLDENFLITHIDLSTIDTVEDQPELKVGCSWNPFDWFTSKDDNQTEPRGRLVSRRKDRPSKPRDSDPSIRSPPPLRWTSPMKSLKAWSRARKRCQEAERNMKAFLKKQREVSETLESSDRPAANLWSSFEPLIPTMVEYVEFDSALGTEPQPPSSCVAS